MAVVYMVNEHVKQRGNPAERKIGPRSGIHVFGFLIFCVTPQWDGPRGL